MNIQKPSLQFRNSLSVRKSTRCIVLHHADAEKFSVYQCHACHLNNGWAGIGYHYYITKDGTIWEGRPDNTVGAHASGGNSDSIGICFEGDYDVERTMPDAQKKAGKELVAHLKAKYGISTVKKHKDITPTTCPGSLFPFEEIAGVKANGVIHVTAVSDKVPVQAPGSIAELQAECNRQGFSAQKVDDIAGPVTLAGCPMIKKGASGNITRWLQRKLNSLGFDCGNVDGDFGTKTKAAVMAFQKAKGLVADGIVGPKTWSKLLGLS